jgi:hypothetical protein
MVGNERPGIAGGPGRLENLPQSLQEVLPIGIALDYLSPFNSSANDVMGQSMKVLRSPLRYNLKALDSG